jgi:amino-acid N-acetyltransferase
MPEVVFRPALIDDVRQIQRLIAPSVTLRKLLPRTFDELAKLAINGFVAEAAGRIVGFAAVEIYSRKLAELQCLAVSDAFQRQGLGSELIRLCVQRARDLGVYELMAITASEGMFEKFGFHYSLPDQKKALFIQFPYAVPPGEPGSDHTPHGSGDDT